MYVVSISGIVATVFGLIVYVLAARRADNQALRAANAHVSSLVSVLEAQVQRAETAEQEALLASVAKSRFLANMSHELRTPLNAILGYTELMLEDLDGRWAGDLQRVREAGQLLLQMINDILDLAKIEAGHTQVDEELIDLAEVIGAVVGLVEPLAKRNGNRIVTEIDGELGPVVSDRLKVYKILYNLIGNAAKFTQDGTIRVRASLEGGVPQLRVDDTGIGMTQEQLAKVLQPFVQADSSTTRRFGGTGLGLHLVHRYVSMLGGELTLASNPGEGTHITVALRRSRRS